MISAVGEVDIDTAPCLTEALRNAPAHVPIIVDLCGVMFMDCTGLHPILRAHCTATTQRTAFILVPSPAVSRLLHLTGLHHTVATSPTLTDALTAARTT